MRRSGMFVLLSAGLVLALAVVLWLGSSPNADGGAAASVGAATPSAPVAGPDALPPARAGEARGEAVALAVPHPPAEVPPPDAMPASYRAALGGLTGRVLEHTPGAPETLRPVAGLSIELAGGRKSSIMPPRDALLDPARLQAEFILGSAVTDAEGRFELGSIDPRTLGALLLDPGGPRGMFWPLEVTPVGGRTSDLGDLVLPPTATLFGRVVDERSAPIAGARVRATDLPIPEAFAGPVAGFRGGSGLAFARELADGEAQRVFVPPPSLARLESRLPFPTAITDAQGRFELTGVPQGLVLLVADDGVHRPAARSGVPTGAAGGRRDAGLLAMADGQPLEVAVRGPGGQTIAAPQVLAGNPLPGAPVAVLAAPTGLDDQGRGRFSGLAEGAVWVAARADPRHDFTVVELPDVGVGRVTITLKTPHALTLTVLDAGGAPLPGASFFGRALNENQTPDFVLPPLALADRTQAGDQGRYVISDLDPTTWEITTVVPGHPQNRLNADLSGGDATAEVRLAAGHPAAVRVVSAADGAPVEWALVEARPEDDGMELDLFSGPASARRTDSEGLALFSDLPPGPVKFTVNHPAFAVTDAEAALPSEDELRVALSPGGSIAGQVFSQGGPPAEPLIVMLVQGDAPGDAELPRFALTGPEGRFEFLRVEPGSVSIQARSRMEIGASASLFETMFNSPLAEASVEVADGRQSQVELVVGAELEGTETGLVSGRLTVNGAPAAGWRVRTWGKVRRSVSTDEGGLFDLGRIEAGEVSLLVSAPTQNIGNGFTDQRRAELKPGEQLWLPIDLTVGSIAGQVRSAATGEPLPGAEVSAAVEGEQGGWGRNPGTVSAGDGSFAIDPVVSGHYRLRASADGYARTVSDPIEVSAFQTRSGIVLSLPAALKVSGTIEIQGATAKPKWVYLVASGGEGREGREGARIDSGTMSFRFERLGPGDWEFELNTDLDVAFAPVKVALTGDAKDLKLVFAPKPPEPADENGDGSPFVYEVK